MTRQISHHFARKALHIALLFTCYGALVATEASARPATPPQPTWRQMNDAPPPPLSPPNSKRANSATRKKSAPARHPSWTPTEFPSKEKPDTTEKATAPLPERKSSEARNAPEVTKEEAKKAADIRNAEKPVTDAAKATNDDASEGKALDVVTTEVLGEEEKSAEKEKADEKKDSSPDAPMVPPAPTPVTEGPVAKQYCTNIATAAADARFAWQKKQLMQTEEEVAKRIEELNLKIAEYKKWLARRDDFSRKAEATVINIYAKMKPDAAAQQLTVLDEDIAAAVLTKLTPRTASAIMNEMEAKRAARLTAIITGAAKGPGKKPAASSTPPAPASSTPPPPPQAEPSTPPPAPAPPSEVAPKDKGT